MNEERCTVLIVDDEPTNVQLLEGALRKRYRLLSANNGFDAIRLVKEELPDLVLLDVMMPDLSGFDVARLLKSDESFQGLPIIFLTALDSGEAEAEGLEAGGIDFLTKPVNLGLLQLRVHNHLELKRKNDRIARQRDLLERRTAELEAALQRIKRLEGTLSICMHCKNIRNDSATWQRLELYLLEHTDALFSHCICPDCVTSLYLELREETPTTPG